MQLLSAEEVTKRTGAEARVPVLKPRSRETELRRSPEATVKLYEKMVAWGWIDGIGRTRDWTFWQKAGVRYAD